MALFIPVVFNGPKTAVSRGCNSCVVCGTRVNILTPFSLARVIAFRL